MTYRKVYFINYLKNRLLLCAKILFGYNAQVDYATEGRKFVINYLNDRGGGGRV